MLTVENLLLLCQYKNKTKTVEFRKKTNVRVYKPNQVRSGILISNKIFRINLEWCCLWFYDSSSETCAEVESFCKMKFDPIKQRQARETSGTYRDEEFI